MKNKLMKKLIILLVATLLCSVFLLSCDVFKNNNNSTAFKIEEITPLDGATGVSQSTTISASFSSDIDKTTATEGTIILMDDKGNSVAGKVSSFGINISFTPTDKLAKLTTYTVTIRSQLKDSGGRTLGSDFTSSFTTGDDSA
jgi:hypothetical protein